MGLLGFDEIKSRLERYCAFQERSPFEVKKKLNSFTSDSKQIDGIMASLIKEGFLNQERFVESYVQGKVNQKRWGKEKIKELFPKLNIISVCHSLIRMENITNLGS